MSDMGELRRLEVDLKESEDLTKRLDEAMRHIVEEGKVGSDGEAMAAAAAELGYDISAADLERASAKAADVDDAELESVAGGNNVYELLSEYGMDEYGHDDWCLTAWHCLAVTLHTECKVKGVQCWSNYNCIFINN